MNDLATVGIVGAAVGVAKGVIDQKNAQKYDSQASTDVGSYIKNGISNAIPLGLAAMGGYAGISTLLGKDFAIKGTSVKDIAKSIAGNVYPGKNELAEELNETIAKNMSSNKKYVNEKTRDILNGKIDDLIEATSLSDDLAKKAKDIVANTNQSNLDKNISELNKIFPNENVVHKTFDRAKKEIGNITISPDNVKRELGDIRYKMNIPKAYFTNPDKTVRNTRAGVAVGTYAGLAVGGRYLQGGSLTRDEYGRRDIAGVPFL